MLSFIKKIFGLGPEPDYKTLVGDGALILDVRTKSEYKAGHIQQSKNIPVDELKTKLSQLNDKSTPIITCCASGMRSMRAKSILKSNGYTEVYNGGSWQSLDQKLH